MLGVEHVLEIKQAQRAWSRAQVAALLDKLEGHLCVDLNRVYVTGFSNGGLLAYELAMSLSDRIAAVAAVAGGVHPGFLRLIGVRRRIAA